MLFARYKPNKTQLERLEGYEGMILQTLSEKINFSFILIDCKMKWETKHQDGTWDGIVGAVYQGVVKILFNGLVNFFSLRKLIWDWDYCL